MLTALSLSRENGWNAVIRSDSEYVLKGMQEWLPGWKQRGWRGSSGKPVVNKDLWEMIDGLLPMVRSKVRFEHVRGHSGDALNEACDRLAVAAREKVAAQKKPFNTYEQPEIKNDSPTLG